MSAAPTDPLPSWTRESLTAIPAPGAPTGGRPSAAPAGDQPQGGPARAPGGAADVQAIVDRPHAPPHVASLDDHRDVVLGRSLSDRHDVHAGVAQRAEDPSGDPFLSLHPGPDHGDGAHVALDGDARHLLAEKAAVA